jgi:hypothetical protein
MAIIRLWGVLGEGSVGKSTTIGHLAGDFGRSANGLRPGRGGGLKEIPLRGGGYLTIHPRRVSLQESGRSPGVAAKEIARESARVDRRTNIQSAYFNALLAIRTDRFGEMPRAAEYLSYFAHHGWQIESLLLLSPNARDTDLYRHFGAPTCDVYGSTTDYSILQMVGRVKNHFGWA